VEVEAGLVHVRVHVHVYLYLAARYEYLQIMHLQVDSLSHAVMVINESGLPRELLPRYELVPRLGTCSGRWNVSLM